jgi:tetratricopeptide (TPR) repeat protein
LRSPLYHLPIIAWSRKYLRLGFALGLLLLFAEGNAAPQTSHVSSNASQPSKTNSAFHEARQLLQQGLLDQAKQEILEQLRLNPSSVEGYNLLEIIYSEQKDYPNALDALQHALTLDPASTETRNNIGNIYIAEGHSDLAKKEFQRVLSADPANRDANYNLGLVLLATGSPAEAIPHFQRVRPLDTETRLNLVRAYLHAGKSIEGLKEASTLAAGRKNDVELHATLGILLASEKQYKAAGIQLEAANALRPDTFEILYNLGETYLRTGDYAKAELTLTRALKLKPDSAEALYLLAQVDSEQKRPVDALDLLVRAHKLAPENIDVIFLLARVSMSQNYFEDAIPLLESGLELAPQRGELRAALGESYFMSGKTEKGIDEFQKLIEIDRSASSYAFMGLSYRHLGRFDEARKYFEQGVKLDPKNASCLFNIGYIEERQGNYKRAEELFQQVLRSNPDFSEALLELANLRAKNKNFADAEALLKRYVRVSRDPAAGYYKLAMVERSLHETQAAQRDLNVFQTLSKNSTTGPYPYQHLFEYLDNRSALPNQARTQLDLTELTEEIQKHPGQPEDLYLLAETYLKLGQVDEARKTIGQLDQISADDFRTQAGVGVLLARYRLYDDAIGHFQTASRANPDSDDVKFDIAAAFFRKGAYSDALQAAQSISETGFKDDAYLALLGDIYAHLGETTKAAEIFRNSISRNPDNDQYYLSLTLIQLRENDLPGAEQTLEKGLARIPNSGKIEWGLGLVSVLQGKTAQAAERLERAVDLLPEWVGSYSTLGIFYYQTGQIDKAREVLDRFKGSNAGGLDVGRIEETLSKAPATKTSIGKPLPMEARQQLLQMALTIADRTL